MSIQPTSGENPPKYGDGPSTSLTVQQPQTWAAPTTAQPYSNQPQQPGGPWGYPGPYPGPYPGYAPPPPPPPQQQQQQQVVVVNNTGVAQVQLVESFGGQIITACLVLWFCNCLFGLVGFILAMVAGDKAGSDPETANKLGKASYGVSISGIFVSIIVIGTIVGIIVGGAATAASSGSGSGSCYYYEYLGSCYTHRDCSSSSSYCYSYHYGVYSSTTGCCYYD